MTRWISSRRCWNRTLAWSRSPIPHIRHAADGMKGRCAVNLHNAVTMSQEHHGKRVCSLKAERINQVCAALRSRWDAGELDRDRTPQAIIRRLRSELALLGQPHPQQQFLVARIGA
jgi:hypothetical protein